MKRHLLLFSLLLLISGAMFAQEPPTVVTNPVTNIQQTTATGGGTVISDSTVTERGICWGTGTAPTTNGSHLSSGTGTGAFTCNMSGLTANTKYYVRAYAVNSAGTAYGDTVSFTTLSNVGLATVSTTEVTNIQQTTATGGGNVTNNGGGTVTERGICWSTGHNPTTNGSHATNGTGTGAFTCNMSGLTANTKYYVRAYAVNSAGTAYGNEVEFTTLQNVNLPSVSTADVTNIQQTTATGGGNVASNGGGTVTERGICWGTGHNPTTNGSHLSGGTGTGAFTCNMTGLTAGTTYYVRAYAVNSAGTAYGNEVSFSTLENLPTVSSVQISDITQTTATATANVTSGVGVTERGVCWGTNHNPSTNGSHGYSSTGGLGVFQIDMTNLTPGTTYYVRAYAKNTVGTAYGDEASFTTESIAVPTVTTSQVTNITQTSATGGGNVTYNGGANVTERGICWGVSPNPTTSGTHQSNGSGTGAFTVTMNNLTPDVTYYVRAYAKNSAGTGYGNEVQFITSDLPIHQITLLADPQEGGEVIGAGAYQETLPCEIEAIANTGYTFINWTKNGVEVSTNSIYNFTISEDATYIAHFRAITYSVTVSADPEDGGTVSTDIDTYTYGQPCTVTAFANPGFVFRDWSENGEIVSMETEYTFAVHGNHNLVAHFESQTFTIAVYGDPNEGGTVEGGGTFAYNAQATLKATPNEGYRFSNWKENDILVSDEAIYSFPVRKNRVLIAHFEKLIFNIEVKADPQVGGTVIGGGNYPYGETATLQATANSGYTFEKWDDNSTENPRVITVTDHATYTALFTRIEYVITTHVTPSETGTVKVDGTPYLGDTITLTAIEYLGYHFLQWGDDVTDNPRTVIVTGDMEFTAVFEKTSCITDMQEIQAKEHKAGNETYPLILIYPNPNDEDYEYQWCFSQDGVNYIDLTEGTYNKQYYYIGGRLKAGSYKVRLTQGECSDETKPYEVRDGRLCIYPNPAFRYDNMVVVKDCEGPAYLTVYSLDGRLLHTQLVTDDRTTIDVKLPQGVYVAYLTNHNDYLKVGKLIIH